MYESKYNDAIESLEMMTLDKEVAEERAENLQQEVNVLKDKIEEISVDLDILRKEADIINRIPEREGDEKTPLEVIQLERHNERLKEALVRLRDATTARENELCERIKDLEKDTYELEDVKAQYVKTRDRLQVAELTIEELKQSLDDALGAEDLVEQLTEKNLALTEKMEEMHLVIEDLEALKELADELEDNHIETEKQLQAEIDHRDMLLREQMERVRAAEETNMDYEATIQQFRELVSTLQNDLEHLKHKEVSQQSERRTLSSQSQAMMSLNIQLQSTVMKAQAKSIDLELRKLEAQQANDRLSYIQPYLPDAFFKTENDAISCVLLFKRLMFKSELIIKHLDQNHPISERIMDTVPESLISVCEMRQRAGWLSDLSKRFVTFTMNCNPTTFIKMGQVYHDLIGTERRLTGIVDLLRTDEVNEGECVTELQRMIAQLEHLSEIHLIESENNHADQFFGLTRALDLNADRMTVELTFLKQIVENAARKENITIVEGLEKLDYDYLEPLNRLIVQAKNSKILAKKLLRQLEDLTEQALTLTSDYLHRFKMLYAISTKLCKFCFETYKQITRYVETRVGSKEDISLGIIQQTIYNKADEILEIPESSMWEGCLKTLKSLTNELNTTHERISNETKTQKITIGVSPWTQRASDMKAEIVINHDMERKLQQHSDEILKLIKDVKLKDQALQEAHVKIELLEKRMETVKKQAEQIQILEETLAKSQQQEQMYSEAIDNLQAEYDNLEQEHTKLKKEIAQKEEKRLSASKKAELFIEDAALMNSENEENNLDIHNLNSQLESLKCAIRYLRAENAHLKESDMLKTLHMDYTARKTLLPPTPPLTDDEGDEEDEEYENKEPDFKSMVRSVLQETRLRRPTISGASKKSASPVTGLTKRNSALSKIKPSSPTPSPTIPRSTFSYSQINSEDSPKSPLQGRALYRQDGQRSPSTLSNKSEHDQASLTSELQQEINEETDEDDIDDNKSETNQEEKEEEDYSNDPSRTQSAQSNQPVPEKEDIVKTTSTTSKTPSNQAPTYGSLAANLPVTRKTLLPPTPPLTDDEGDEEDEEYENKEPDFKSMVRSVLQETRTLVKDVRLATATTKIVQLSPERRGGKWQRKKNLPDYQYQMQQSVLYTLKRRCESLKEKMKHIQNNERYTKWSQKSALAEKEHNKKLMKAFAKIHFPATAIVTESKRHIQLESFREFEKIHNLFI
ncbi:Putative Dynactin 1 [Rhizopus microsporus]|nr:Putative Dynactin 1 [Rhizopus microsporus]